LDCRGQAGIDLHIHSTASDGTLTPVQILDLAQAHHLKAIAITDHDTVCGSRTALASGIPSPLRFLTGVEISAAPPPFLQRSGSFHILGYGLDLDDEALNQALRVLQKARKNRNPAIIDRLGRLGFTVSLSEVAAMAGESQIGRPHIAQAMLKKGYVHSVDEAFDRFLAAGKPAYVDKYRISCRRALDLVHGAGGIPVLAHPHLLGIHDAAEMEALIVALKNIGLEGIEVYYPEHPPQATAFFMALADRHRLLMTGGTDFHGSLTPEIQIGCGSGDFRVPFGLYERLNDRLTRRGGHAGQGCRGGRPDSADPRADCTPEAGDASDPLMRKLGYRFNDHRLIAEAFRHSSYVNELTEGGLRDNERLEFLGDAVLNLAVAHLLMQRYPEMNEGDLSRMRANLVNEPRLADIARKIDLGSRILLGKGESLSSGRDKNSILADALEAVVAAVFLDGGFGAARRVVERHLAPLLESIPRLDSSQDFKSRLQETVQVNRQQMPDYVVVGESGPDHDKTFRVRLRVMDWTTEGLGKSKKQAEQDAARKALEILRDAQRRP
jgi:ribonuclease III